MIVGPGGAVVALGEGVHDGRSETRAAGGACGVGAAETVEGVWEEGVWEPGTVVGDPDLDSVGADAVDVDGDRRGAVLGGVVDEVADNPIEIVGVDADVLAWGGQLMSS